MWTGFKAEMVEVAKLNNSVGSLAFHRPILALEGSTYESTSVTNPPHSWDIV